MRKLVFVFGVILFTVGYLHGQEDSDSTANFWKENIVPNNGFIDPDKPIIQLSRIGGRWVNKIGASIHFAQATFFGLDAKFSVDPFIEIHDFNTTNYFSWELWRGSFGLNIQCSHQFITNKSAVLPSMVNLSLGYYHESDHASSGDFTRRFSYFFLYETFPNGSFGAFEYLKVKSDVLHFDEQMTWMIDWSFFFKLFPDPILKKGARKQTGSLGAEVFARQMVTDAISIHIAGYYEIISSDFVAYEAGFFSNFNRSPLIYRIAEVGLTFTASNGTRYVPYIMFTSSSGRGLDFLSSYREIGYGFRILL